MWPIWNTSAKRLFVSLPCLSLAAKFDGAGVDKLRFGGAMVERIFSKLSENAYEATLAVCGVCCLGSLLLAATV